MVKTKAVRVNKMVAGSPSLSLFPAGIHPDVEYSAYFAAYTKFYPTGVDC